MTLIAVCPYFMLVYEIYCLIRSRTSFCVVTLYLWLEHVIFWYIWLRYNGNTLESAPVVASNTYYAVIDNPLPFYLDFQMYVG